MDVAAAGELRGFLDLDQALLELFSLDERKARLIELKFFGGLTIDEMAESVGVSTATVERDLKVAQTWLRQRLEGAESPARS